MIKIRDVPNLTLGKADSGSRSNVAIGIEASATTDFELAISRINEEPKYQLVINNEGTTSNATNYGGIAFTQGVAATTVMASIKVDYTTTDGYPNLVFGTRSASDALTILDNGDVQAAKFIGAFVGNLTGDVTGTVSTLSNHDTDSLSEGSTNLYFTNERAQDTIGTMLSGNTETLISVTYDDTNNEIDFVVDDDLSKYSNTSSAFITLSSISVTDSGGDGSLAYDNSTGVITYTGPSATDVRAHFSEGTGVSINNGAISIGQAVATNGNVVFNQVTAALVGNASTATTLETARDITIGKTSSQAAGDIDGITNSFDGSANISFDSKLFDHLASFIDPTANPQAQIDASAGVNMTAVAQANWADEIIIGSSTVYPTLKINRKGQIIGFKEEAAGQGGAGGVGRVKLITHGKLYTNDARTAQDSGFLSPTNGDISLNFYLKDAALGGSLVVGSGNNDNKIGLQAVDGSTDLGYITVPYATTAGSANGGAAEALTTVKSDTDASYYLTFVDSNNDSATHESFYTDDAITYNPNKDKLTVNKIKCDTNLATADNTTTTALKHIIGKVDGGTVHYDFTDGQVQTFLGLKSAAYETKGTFALATQVLTNFPANALFTDTNTNTTYSISIPSSTTKQRLTDSDTGTDDIEFVGSGATSVTRTNANKFTISSTDTNTDTNNYLDGITKGTGTDINKLTFSVNGKTDQSYTFGANAFTSYADPTSLGYTTYTADQTVNPTSNVQFNTVKSVLLTRSDIGVKSFNIEPYTNGIDVTAAEKAAEGTLSAGTSPTTSSLYGKLWSIGFMGSDQWGRDNYGASTIKIVYGSRLGSPTRYFNEGFIARSWRISQYWYSDARIKTDVEDLSLGLDFIKKLRPVEFRRTTDATPRKNCGLIAQELEAVLEEVGVDDLAFIGVPNYHNLSEEEKQDALKSVNYDLINTCLLKAVQELAAKVEALEAKLEEN